MPKAILLLVADMLMLRQLLHALFTPLVQGWMWDPQNLKL